MRKLFSLIALVLSLMGCAPQAVTPVPAQVVITSQPVVVTVVVPQVVTLTPEPQAIVLPQQPTETKAPECPSAEQVVDMLNNQLKLAGDKLKNWHPQFSSEFVGLNSGKCVFAVTLQPHGVNERNTEIYSHDVQTSMEYLVTHAASGSNLFTFQWAKSEQKWYRQPVESLENGALFGGFYWYIPSLVR